MNPEFRRQLWLQFSSTRLIVLPLLLLACFTAVILSAPAGWQHALAMVGALLFCGLVWGMGTLAAGASVIDEVIDRTWDQQRMSAMQPWAMTWGKLAGASAYGWYGGALCLLVAVPCALMGKLRELVPVLTLGAILAGVFLQALLVAVNLQLVKTGGSMARRGGGWPMLLLLLLLWASVGALREEQVPWWGDKFNSTHFVVASLALFSLCALVAAWRTMAEVLAVRQMPWGWPALAVVLSVYFVGFAPTHHLQMLGVVGLGTCIVLTYFALLTEPQPRPLWQRIIARLAGRQWLQALQQLPRWPTTLGLAFLFACWVMLSWDQQSAARLELPLTWQPMVVILFAVRDCALALFFAFAVKGRRPVLAFLVLMLVLYGLLPWLLGALAGPMLVMLVLPWKSHGILSLLIAAIHAAVALGLLRSRWLASAPQVPRQSS
jgi:hypothetical protein